MKDKNDRKPQSVYGQRLRFFVTFFAVLSYIQDVRFSTLMQAAGMPASARCLPGVCRNHTEGKGCMEQFQKNCEKYDRKIYRFLLKMSGDPGLHCFFEPADAQ